MEETDIAPSTKSIQGEKPVSERIAELQESLRESEQSIKSALDDSIGLVLLFAILCIGSLIFGWNVLCFFIDEKNWPPKDWTWQVIYVTTLRVTALSAIIAVSTFCFNTFKSYLHITQKNREKLMIITSMASLVESAASYGKRELVFEKLFTIITDFSDTGLHNKKNDFELPKNALEDLSDLAKELRKKE